MVIVTEIARHLYEGGPTDVVEVDGRLATLRNEAWARFRETRRDKSDATAYQRTFGEFVRRLSDTGLLDAQDLAHPSGSELHLATWLARSGHRVEFLREDGGRGTRSPDVSIDGLAWEIKQPTSGKVSKAKLRIAEGLEQASRVIADLSRSPLSAADAIGPIAGMLSDPAADELMIVAGGSLFGLRRRDGRIPGSAPGSARPSL